MYVMQLQNKTASFMIEYRRAFSCYETKLQINFNMVAFEYV